MYCEDNFIFCMRNADCPQKGTGRLLYLKKGNLNERLYIHLTNNRDTSFYCVYNQIDEGQYKYKYKKKDLVTETDLSRDSQNGEENNRFQQLRMNHSIMFDGWEERFGPLPYQEEINFLKSIDKEIISITANKN